MNITHAGDTPRRWRTVGGAAGTCRKTPTRGSRRKVVLLCSGLGLVLAALVLLCTWVRPVAAPPTLLALVVERYQALALGEVACAGRDLQTVRAALTGIAARAPGLNTRDAWLHLLGQLKDEHGDTPAVVYVKGLAARNEEGAWCVLPADADPLQPNTWLPLRTILEQVRACPAAHKLIVLDLAAPPQGWTLGLIDDDVAAGLAEEVHKVPDAARLVLSACAPGQETHTSPALGQSLFAHYWQEGLRGAADGCGDGVRDGQVTIHELAAYLQTRVDCAAVHLRGQRQTPMLLGAGADFPLAMVQAKVNEAPLPAPNPYPGWLQEAWQWRDGIWADGTFAEAPRLFQHLQALLVKAETAWRGGADENQLAQHFQEKWAAQRKEWGRQTTLVRPRAVALAQEPGDFKLACVPDIVAALAQLHLELLEVSDKNRERRRDQRLAELVKKQPQAPANAWEAAAWTWVRAQDPLDGDQVRLAAALACRSGPPRHLETMTMVQLSELAQRLEPGAWPAALGRQLIQVVDLEAQALRRAEAYPHGRKVLAAACQARHDGAVRLLAQGFADPDDAHILLDEAAAKFTQFDDQANRWHKIRRGFDEMQARCAWTMTKVEAKALGAMAGNLRDLKQALDEAATAMLANQDPASAGLALLTDSSAQDLEKKSRQPEADAKLAAQLENCLEQPAPGLTAPRRVALNQALVDLDKRLLETVRRLELDKDMPPAGIDNSDPGAAAKRQQALARAHGWVNWLALAELPPPDLHTARQGLDRLALDPNPDNYAQAETAVRRLITTCLPQRLLQATDNQNQAWMTACFPTLVEAPGLESKETPAQRRRLDHARKMQAWLADWHRYQALDYQGLADFLPGCARAASHCEQVAKDLGPVPPAGKSYVTLRPQSLPARLTATQPAQRFTLEIQRNAPGELTVGFFTAKEGGLAVGPTGLAYPALDTGISSVVQCAPVQVEYRPNKGAGPGAAPGLLARARCEGRSYHAIIPVGVHAARPDVQIFLSANAKEPEAGMAEIRLTPNGARQVYFLFLKNGANQARKVTVEARIGDLPLPGLPREFALEPGETRRVLLGDTLSARQPLVECAGPLELRVMEAAAPQRLLDAKTVPLHIVQEASALQVVNYPQTGNPTGHNKNTPFMHLVGARYVKPTASYPLKLEVGQAPEEASLEVRVIPGGRDDGASAWLKRFPHPRDRRITFGLAGGLVFAAHDADWTVELDTRQLRGLCQLQARLLDPAGKELRRERRDLIIDDDPPSIVRIIDCPRKAEKGTPIYVQAEGRDDESGIAEAVFFVGRPQGDQIPEGTTTVAGTPLAADNTGWSARLDLPRTAKGATPITVRFVNGVGLARCVTRMVEATDVDPILLEPGHIAGKVMEGPRPQPGLTVILKDEAGREKARTQTRPNGAFAFPELAPGRYQVFCLKPETGRRGQSQVIVAPDRTATVQLQLSF